jgi:L-amino acid N-acyltransferase YncA
MSLVVRSATLSDADVEACRALYGWYVQHTTVSFELEPPDLAEMRRRMAACLETHAWLLLEDEGGALLGYAYGGVHRARPAYRFSAEVSVYVAPGHHRRGFGRTLYLPLLERLRERGYRLALAGVTLPNPGSVGLHESLGFEPIGRFPRVGWKDGAWHDTGWWALPLGDESAPTGLR